MLPSFDHSTPTPFYLYDMKLLQKTVSAVKAASSDPAYHIHYAMKANANQPILKLIRENGFGIDIVSGGELKRALDCGFDSKKIVFAGVGKSDEEILSALKADIGCFNVESEEELDIIAGLAKSKGCIAKVALRVNPEIDAHTHHYITTGIAENKFGIDMSRIDDCVRKALNHPSLEFKGLHFHIGSQITSMEPYIELCQRINRLQDHFDSIGIKLPTINVGGGLGIDYDSPDQNPVPDFKSYFDVFRGNLSLRPGQQLHFELGRAVVGQCGSLISRVLYIKKGVAKKFVILDAGMTDLIRPALYDAHHTIQNISSDCETKERYDVVGPICESSDTFGVDELLPITTRGDLIAIRSAGAYGQIMSSQYNCRQLPAAVYAV